MGGVADLVNNTPGGGGARAAGWEIRRAAVERAIPCITTMTGATAAGRAIGAAQANRSSVRSLQELHPQASRGDGEETKAARLGPSPVQAAPGAVDSGTA
jgi:carbamoyl-phosphate synthase large subunit